MSTNATNDISASLTTAANTSQSLQARQKAGPSVSKYAQYAIGIIVGLGLIAGATVLGMHGLGAWSIVGIAAGGGIGGLATLACTRLVVQRMRFDRLISKWKVGEALTDKELNAPLVPGGKNFIQMALYAAAKASNLALKEEFYTAIESFIREKKVNLNRLSSRDWSDLLGRHEDLTEIGIGNNLDDHVSRSNWNPQPDDSPVDEKRWHASSAWTEAEYKETDNKTFLQVWGSLFGTQSSLPQLEEAFEAPSTTRFIARADALESVLAQAKPEVKAKIRRAIEWRIKTYLKNFPITTMVNRGGDRAMWEQLSRLAPLYKQFGNEQDCKKFLAKVKDLSEKRAHERADMDTFEQCVGVIFGPPSHY